jgi:DNA-binding response OmpR family regulator
MSEERPLVFIVEDDKFLLDMYVIKFSESNFEVQTAFGGEEALKRLEEGGLVPDVMLLDLVMPGMTGFEVLERMSSLDALASTAKVILSNLGQKEDIDKGISLGADGYIVKASATPSEVVEQVKVIMNKKNGRT